jgi:hypothetical protein
MGRGRVFALYVAGYTLGRFFIELIRTDPATRVFGDIRINVVVSAVVFLAAVAYMLVVRGPREDPATFPGAALDTAPAGPAAKEPVGSPEGVAGTDDTAPGTPADSAADTADDTDTAAAGGPGGAISGRSRDSSS